MRATEKAVSFKEDAQGSQALRMSWRVKRERRGIYSKRRALQEKAQRLEAIGLNQAQEPKADRVAGAGCREEWPEMWLQKGAGAG